MADEEDQIELSLEEPAKAEEEVVVDTAPAEIPPDDGINELKKRLEMEKQARQEAERRAQEATKVAQKASTETKDANYQLIVNAIETVKGRSEALKKAYAESLSVGDYERAASIQEALAVNAGQLAELKRGKKAMKDTLKQEEVRPVEPPKGDIVDQLAAAVSPRSAAWLKSQKENIRTERDVRKMFRAHEDAIDDGIEPDTDAYFNFIEQRMGVKPRVEEHEESPMSAAAVKKAPPPPPVPVSRGNQRPNVVRLTRDQVEMAKSLGMTEAEYAKNMVALQREGKMGH